MQQISGTFRDQISGTFRDQVSGTFCDQISAKVIWNSGGKLSLSYLLKSLIEKEQH